MASRPNPSWSEPQKKVHKTIMEALEVVIPYYGEEIPALGNQTPQMICDDLGTVKSARKAFDTVEKTLSERFKPQMGDQLELRGTRYIATKRPSTRTALNQGKCKELIKAADDVGLDLEELLNALQSGDWVIPEGLELPEDKFNEDTFNTSSDVSALYVEPIA